MKSDFTMLEMCLVNEEEEREGERAVFTYYYWRRKKKNFSSRYLCWNIKLTKRKKRTLILYIPAATFNRGCSLLIRINSAEFKLLKLVESSIYI